VASLVFVTFALASATTLSRLALGQTPGQSLAELPELGADDVRACLACATERASHEVRLRVPA
jgi:uncharacterized protein (DUF433 family)